MQNKKQYIIRTKTEKSNMHNGEPGISKKDEKR